MIATLLTILALSPGDSLAAGADSLPQGPTAPAASAPLHDRVATRPVIVLPEVRVDRARPDLDAARREPTGFVSDVRAGSTGHALETVADLVSRSAAVRIQQYGGLGAFATVSLRGAPPNQLALYLDGAPLTSAAQTLVNLGDLPVTAVDRIEVYRGPSPLSLGPVTPGGAINIVTLPAIAGTQAAVVRGSFGMLEARGSAGAARGGWSALVHGGYQGARGDFGYRDDNGTPFNPGDDQSSTRQNNRFDSATALATARGAIPGGWTAALRENLFHKRQGVPGLGAVPALHTRLEYLRSLSRLELERGGAGAWPSFHLAASLDRTRTQFRDPMGELGFGAADADDRTGGEQWVVGATTPPLRAGLVLESFGALRIERGELHDRSGAADPPPSRRDTRGISVAARLEPWRDRVLLSAGRRWDRQRDALRWVSSLGAAGASDLARELDSPELGTRVRLGFGLEGRGNWFKAARAPDFLELFGDEGSVRGNPTLDVERAESWDAGGRWSLGPGRAPRAALEWAHYESHPRNLIAYVRNSASSVRAQNISRARLRGEELSGWAELPRGLSASGWITWQTTLDQGAVAAWRGRRLPLRPERHAFAQLLWRARALRLGGDIEYLSEDFLDRANRQRVPARTLTGASISIRTHFDLRITLDARNLGDVRVADVADFPLPGRSLFVSCGLGADRDPGRAH